MTQASNDNLSQDLFFDNSELERKQTESFVSETLSDCDDGELFLEFTQSENLSFDDGQLKSANFTSEQGFGLRAVSGIQGIK